MESIRVPETDMPALPGFAHVGHADPDEWIAATVWLHPNEAAAVDVARARALGATLPTLRRYDERGELEHRTDADDAAFARVRAHCERHGIVVAAKHWRSLSLRGTIGALATAFGAICDIYEDDEKRSVRRRRGSLHLPPEIAPLVRALFGLETWPRAHANAREHEPERHANDTARAAMPAPLTAAEVAQRYAFPEATGRGQRIGIVQFGGTFERDDFERLLALDGSRIPNVTTVRVDDAATEHRRASSFDDELLLDTQIAASLAPGADLIVYAAPHDERGMLDAVRTALFDVRHAPHILSISFGQPESVWTPAALALLDELFAVAALLGISVFCASGDTGADVDAAGYAHVRAPASSPFAHACGGTETHGHVSHAGEVAWPHSGGGFSARADVEAWQHVAQVEAARLGVRSGRGVPDVAGQVVPGFRVVSHGSATFASGTSAIAPMWAALAARLNERLGAPIGFFAPLLYGAAPERQLFRAIERGGNGTFDAHAGWNPCTGLGAPIGAAILAALREPLVVADEP